MFFFKMHNSKTIFVPVTPSLEEVSEKSPGIFLTWFRRFERALGASQCLFRSDSGGQVPQYPDDILRADRHGWNYTPDERARKRIAQTAIDTWNDNCFKAIQCLQTSISPSAQAVALELWDISLELQPRPDWTFRKIIRMYRAEYCGTAEDQQHVQKDVRELNASLTKYAKVTTDAGAYAMFIEIQKILQSLIHLGERPKNGTELRAMVSSILDGHLFDLDRGAINAILNPPQTLAQIKNVWLHYASKSRNFKILPVSDFRRSVFAVDASKSSPAGGESSFSSSTLAPLTEQRVVEMLQEFTSKSAADSVGAEVGAFRSQPWQQSQHLAGRGSSRQQQGHWTFVPAQSAVGSGAGGRDREFSSRDDKRDRESRYNRDDQREIRPRDGGGGRYGNDRGGGGGRYRGGGGGGRAGQSAKFRRVSSIVLGDGTEIHDALIRETESDREDDPVDDFDA